MSGALQLIAKIQQKQLEFQGPSNLQAGETTASEFLINEEVGQDAPYLCPRAPRAGAAGSHTTPSISSRSPSSLRFSLPGTNPIIMTSEPPQTPTKTSREVV